MDRLSISISNSPISTPPVDSPPSGGPDDADGQQSRPSSRHSLYVKDADPLLTHRLHHDNAILALTLAPDRIYAGTQGGEILVFDLTSLERIAVIRGHSASVLGLCYLEDQNLLCSSAGDRFVNLWNTDTFERAYCLYSSYDIGDLFCVAYAIHAQVLYIGAQNTSIQWHSFANEIRPQYSEDSENGCLRLRPSHFFDVQSSNSAACTKPQHAKSGTSMEISKGNIHHYAHYGYVYCMLTVPDTTVPNPASDWLVSGGGDGIIKVWESDRENGGAINQLFALDDGRQEDYSVLSLALDGTLLYAGRLGGQVNVWDLETRQLVRSLRTDRSDAMSLCVGGGFLFNSSASGHVAMYDKQHRLVSRQHAHSGSILASAVTTHSGRALLVTGGNDDTLAIWDLTDNMVRTTTSQSTTNEQLLDSLKRFIAFRTVSSDPQYDADCRKGASYLRSVFKRFGALTEMLPTENSHNPVILAKFKGKAATARHRKKILFYGHYDVVPADNHDGKWKTDPFTLKGVDGYLYGRGVSDNKGPILAAVFACAELLAEQSLDADIVFLIEGEEECGSRGFEQTIRKHKDIIGDVDWILLANSYWLDNRIPCLTYGLRGLISATVQIESSHPDLHSGVDGSSQLDEPLKDLVMLLSTLTGLHGQVKIPRFYEPIPALSPGEKRLYDDVVLALLSRNPNLGDPEELALSLVRRWREASLTIHRFETSGPSNAAIIPRLAKAAISIRLVPNQEASVIASDLTSHLQTQFGTFGSNNKLTVTIDRKAEPWLGDVTNQLFKTLEEAVMEVWGDFGAPPSRRPSLVPTSPVKAPRIFASPARIAATAKSARGYFGPNPTPTTSDALANGSATTPTAIEDGDNTEEEIEIPSFSKNTVRRKKPLYIREGGSIPAIRFLEKEFDAPAAHLPCGQAGDCAHLDNERLRLINLYNSKSIFRKVFRELPQRS